MKNTRITILAFKTIKWQCSRVVSIKCTFEQIFGWTAKDTESSGTQYSLLLSEEQRNDLSSGIWQAFPKVSLYLPWLAKRGKTCELLRFSEVLPVSLKLVMHRYDFNCFQLCTIWNTSEGSLKATQCKALSYTQKSAGTAPATGLSAKFWMLLNLIQIQTMSRWRFVIANDQDTGSNAYSDWT